MAEEQNNNSLGDSKLQKYFETVFELQLQLLGLEKDSEITEKGNPFSQEFLIGNLTSNEVKDLNTIADFVGDLQHSGLFMACGPFMNKAFGILNISRSRNGFQQEMFTTQTLKQDVKQKLTEGRRGLWGKK